MHSNVDGYMVGVDGYRVYSKVWIDRYIYGR